MFIIIGPPFALAVDKYGKRFYILILGYVSLFVSYLILLNVNEYEDKELMANIVTVLIGSAFIII